MGKKTRLVIVVAVVGLIAAVTSPLWWPGPDRPGVVEGPPENGKGPVAPLPLTPPAGSPFLNTGSEARYVGSQACRECHQEEADSFALSGMSRSMRMADLRVEPPDATIEHKLSGRSLRTTRQDGKLLHREEIIGGGGGGSQAWVVGEHEIKYIVGSGVHFTMYLCEIDGFLVESPLTWYIGKPEWSMSPGYDSPHHLGFQREITAACLFCHAGRATAIDNSYHRIRIDELGISCERCHGPGSLHVARHNGDSAAEPGEDGGEYDRTIVNPARLARDRAEAVCHQCHLQSRAYVDPRGRGLADYRPGLALEDFQHYYRSTDPRQQMKVVGHTEQMMLSRCYTKSDSLTCITCHNPHATPAVEDRPAHYRRLCLDCHGADDTSACTVESARRQQTTPADNCVACHMPTVPTTTLHTAVTHHRIGLHGDAAANSEPKAPARTTGDVLEPVHDLSRYHHLDRQRSLGLATLKRVFQLRIGSGPRSQQLWDRSKTLLLQVRKEGLVDSDVEATLAQLLFEGVRKEEAVRHAAAALEDPAISIESRLNALFALASDHHSRNRPGESLEYLDQLIKLRRSAPDWEMRGMCQLRQREFQAAIESLETAVSIDPELIRAHDILSRLYNDLGKKSKSTRHRHRVRRLQAIFRARQQ